MVSTRLSNLHHRTKFFWIYFRALGSIAARQSRRPREGDVPAGRVPGHLRRAGHAPLDGAGAFAARDIESLAGSPVPSAWRRIYRGQIDET